MEKKKVAVAQLAPVFMNKTETVEKACRAIEEAAAEGASLIVFPEVFISGYPDWVWLIPNSKGKELNALYLGLLENAISEGDAALTRLCKAAKKSSINVVIGANEVNSETSSGTLYNSVFFISEEGRVIGKHRKLMPTGGERLIWGQGDGRSLKSYETSAGKIAALICWENYMPLARYAIYQAGTQILAAPTWDKSPNWLNSMQHIAREGGVFVLSVCQALKMEDIPEAFGFRTLYPGDREWINVGNSCIIAPNGAFLAGPLEAREGLLYAEIDFSDIVAAKRMFDVAGHYTRPDVFNFALKS